MGGVGGRQGLGPPAPPQPAADSTWRDPDPRTLLSLKEPPSLGGAGDALCPSSSVAWHGIQKDWPRWGRRQSSPGQLGPPSSAKTQITQWAVALGWRHLQLP